MQESFYSRQSAQLSTKTKTKIPSVSAKTVQWAGPWRILIGYLYTSIGEKSVKQIWRLPEANTWSIEQTYAVSYTAVEEIKSLALAPVQYVFSFPVIYLNSDCQLPQFLFPTLMVFVCRHRISTLQNWVFKVPPKILQVRNRELKMACDVVKDKMKFHLPVRFPKSLH